MKNSFPKIGLILAATALLSACASEKRVPAAPMTSVPAEEISVPETQDAVPEDIVPAEQNLVPANPAIAAALREYRFVDALAEAIAEKNTAEIYYLAEAVLEVAELEQFVKQNFPKIDVPALDENGVPAEENSLENQNEIARELRYALARRLMRENAPSRAREFFPAELLPAFDDYVATMKAAYDINRDVEARAKSFWEAAMILRGNGDALFASFVAPEELENRQFLSEREAFRVNSRQGLDLPNVAVRRRAAKLAFFAASLLPNDNERTARILLTAGTWLRARDPENANVFYQMIAIRCPKTSIGRECLELHWLPANVPWKREQTWDGVPEADSAGTAE